MGVCVWAKGNTPSKRKIVLLVKYFSVHPVADSSSSFRITLFLVEVYSTSSISTSRGRDTCGQGCHSSNSDFGRLGVIQCATG